MESRDVSRFNQGVIKPSIKKRFMVAVRNSCGDSFETLKHFVFISSIVMIIRFISIFHPLLPYNF
jgi:hypothetical protein